MNAADHSPPLLMHLGILGAGPIGLEMAASAVRAGHRVTVFERGAEIAANMRSWGHVRLFSSNALNLSADGSALLQEAGVALPETEAFPTGAEYVAQYLEPLAAALLKSGKADIRCDCEVLSVGRGSLTKGQAIGANPKRSAAPFELLVLQQGGEEQLVGGLDGLVDASGTYGNPNFLGKGGRPALGERALRADGTIKYVLPNDGPDADALLAAGSIAVIGSGASAITTLAMLRRKCSESPGASAQVAWITRRSGAPYELIENDPLPQRAALHALGNELAASASLSKQAQAAAAAPAGESETTFQVDHYGGCHVIGMSRKPDGSVEIQLERGGENDGDAAEGSGAAAATVVVTKHVLAHVGYRPDTRVTSELQVHYCYASEGPMKLAAAMMAASGGGGGDCLAQASPGPGTMLNPEPNFFVIGMKSYGRGSAFLLRIGHEQVQHVISLFGGAGK